MIKLSPSISNHSLFFLVFIFLSNGVLWCQSLEETERQALESFRKRAANYNEMEELIKNNSRVNYFDPRRSINYTPPLSADEFDKIKSCPNYEKYGLFPTDTREGIIAKHKDCCFPDDNTTILVISAIIALGFGTILGLYFMNFNK